MAKHKVYRKTFRFEGVKYDIEADSQQELDAKVAVKQYELEHPPERTINRSTTVEKWIMEYIETDRRDFVTHKQYTDLKTHAKKITNRIGKMPLKDVKQLDCKRVIQSMDGKSYGYIKKVIGLMRSAFDAAVDEDLMLKNPVPRKIRMPEKAIPNGKRRAATEAEISLLLPCGERMGDPYDAFIKLILYFGLRPSEAARVQGCHFDIEKMALRVVGTKTDNATRDVPIPGHLINWINGYRKKPFELLMQNRDGREVNEQARYRLWNAIRRDIHIHVGGKVYRNQIKPPYVLADDLTAYCLRHSYASDMITKGIPKEIVSLIMGHADIDVTDIYIEITPAMFADALSKINT